MIGLYRSRSGWPRNDVKATYYTGTTEEWPDITVLFQIPLDMADDWLRGLEGRWLVKVADNMTMLTDRYFRARYYFVRRSSANGKQGFGSMPPERRRELGAKGGRVKGQDYRSRA